MWRFAFLYKNITSRTLSRLSIRFRCKDRSGAVVCDDRFDYLDLNTDNGQIFGSDDAVYISQSPVGSVEVDLLEATFADGGTENLTRYPRVHLQPAKKLPAEIAQKLCERTHKDGLTVVPQVLDDGWYCACGAFHPRAEEGVWCSECGADRILLQNTLSSLLQTEPVPEVAPDSEPTRMVSDVRPQEPTRMVPPVRGERRYEPVNEEPEDDSDMLIAQTPRVQSAQRQRDHAPISERESDGYRDDMEEELSVDRRDEIADLIIRWAPPITAILCAAIVVIGYFLM
ncbi:acidic leucine-rich nuclear phosphoprotein 32 family member B [gut metagenome]|uniref:Acidic leucine-rich nuclear phosphoprotein 32 family member B n=1 Tax=gut metagenome TaxID=749906 RepID=J9GJ07_9ZZZZ